MKRRFDEIQTATHSYHQDAEDLTAHFVEILKQRGVDSDMLDRLCASLQCVVCWQQNSPNGKAFSTILHAGLAGARVANHLHGVQGGQEVLYRQVFFCDENRVFKGESAFDGPLPNESVEEHEKEGRSVVADN